MHDTSIVNKHCRLISAWSLLVLQMALALFSTLRAETQLFDEDIDNDAMKHVKLDTVFDPDCETRSGELVVVSSTHPDRNIEAQLERYFMDVRQGGRSVVELKPGTEASPLGCNRVLMDGAEQYWKLVKATYLD